MRGKLIRYRHVRIRHLVCIQQYPVHIPANHRVAFAIPLEYGRIIPVFIQHEALEADMRSQEIANIEYLGAVNAD